MNKKLRIYTAGAISGTKMSDTLDYFTRVKDQLEAAGYEVFSPLTGKGYLRTEENVKAADYTAPISTNHAIIERDRWMVKKADVIYCNLIGATRVSIGSMMELAWAHDNGVHSILAMDENNIHRHAFVLEAADIIYPTAEEALAYLVNFIDGGF